MPSQQNLGKFWLPKYITLSNETVFKFFSNIFLLSFNWTRMISKYLAENWLFTELLSPQIDFYLKNSFFVVLSIETHQEVALEEASNHDIIFADDITFVYEKGSENPIETNPKGSKNSMEIKNSMEVKNTETKSLLKQRKSYKCSICLKMITKGQ